MNDRNSYRTILRSSTIMGGASVLNVVIGLVRMKLVAVLLGPAGVGLIGLLQNLMQAASDIAAMGLGTVGVRQIAEANGDGRADDVVLARRALLWGTVVLALLGGAAIWFLRAPIAKWSLGDSGKSDLVGWLALGVAFTVAAGSQGALLNGLRRIGDLARLQVATGFLGTVLGVGAILLWGEAGLVAYVLSAPIATFVLGHVFVMRAGIVHAPPTPWRIIVAQWRVMIPLGSAYVLSGLVTTGGFLVVRSLVQRDLGPVALGHFQAAWAIGMTHLGFVLGAMGTDYYPRLCAALHDPAAATRLVNEQTEVALLLAAPAVLGVLAVSPWLVPLLYTEAFTPTIAILHWQLLGDLLKVMSWPLGFVILAAGAGRTFLVSETISLGVFVAAVGIGLPSIGVLATGVGFLVMYLVYLPVVWWLARRRIGFAWSPEVVGIGLGFFVAASAVSALSLWSQVAAALVGLTLAGASGLYALDRLRRAAGLSGRMGQLASAGRAMALRMGMLR